MITYYIPVLLCWCMLKWLITSPLCYSYVIYARHMESGPSLAQQMHVIHFIACQLTLSWTIVRGIPETFCKTFSIHSFCNFVLYTHSLLHISNLIWSSVAYELYTPLSRLMVRMCESSLLGLLITLDLRVLMPWEWYLQLLLHAHGQKSCRLGCVYLFLFFVINYSCYRYFHMNRVLTFDNSGTIIFWFLPPEYVIGNQIEWLRQGSQRRHDNYTSNKYY